jgi:hypothetical protein
MLEKAYDDSEVDAVLWSDLSSDFTRDDITTIINAMNELQVEGLISIRKVRKALASDPQDWGIKLSVRKERSCVM